MLRRSVPMRFSSGLFALAVAASCSSSPGRAPVDAQVGEKQTGTDSRAGDARQTDLASPDRGGPQNIAPPRQSGVVYVAHYHTKDLHIYRTDGAQPVAEPVFDLGKISHDVELDPFADLLFVAADAAREIDIYQLSRPTGPTQPLAPPRRVATISLEPDLPLFVRVNPQRKRLYAVVAPPTAGVVAEYDLHGWDVSTPDKPEAIAGSPFKIPVTTSLDVDGARELLFVVGMKEKKLFGYDLSGDQLQPLPGAPIELLTLFPQENQFAFQARHLVVDPQRHRLYAARAQSALSELLVFDYPETLPLSMSDVKRVDDPFDVDSPIAERPHILDAFVPAVDAERGHLFLSASSHDGTGFAALVVAISKEMALGPGCEDFESFGCWYSHYSDGQPTSHVTTDGALCVDAAHRVVVGTSVAPWDEADPGSVHFFRYGEDLKMEPWVPASGKTLKAGGLPISAVCH